MPTINANPPSVFARRDFLRLGSGLAAAGFLWPALEQASQAAPGSQQTPGKAKSCILIYLLGGPPHLDMWDLKPTAPAEVRGPFKPISTNVPGMQICEHMPKLAQLADRYALVRSVSHNNHNHTPMIYYTLTGREVAQPGQDNDVRPPQRTDFPHVGAVLASRKSAREQMPGYIAIPELAVRSSTSGQYKRARPLLRGGGGGFLGPLVDPLGVNGEPGTAEAVPALALPKEISADRFERRAAFLSLLENQGPALSRGQAYADLRRQAILLSGAKGAASPLFSLETESAATRESYGQHRFGKALLLARRLAEAEVPMVAVHFNEMTVCDGWDTHSKNFEALQSELLPTVDQSLSALMNDLRQRGLLEQTLIVVMGEFGRTPRINAQAGRDHWGSCQSVLLAGGGIQGGRVFGASDKIGAFPASHAVDPVDIHATMFHCLGIDPEQTMLDHLRRPFSLTTGKVIGPIV